MATKFEAFAALHVPGAPVILYNIWDVGSAHAVIRAGAKALATGSHPVADANGWPDGQGVPIDFALANAKRIADSTELPLTVDFESAYSDDPDQGADNVVRLAATGAVGCNFEDQVIGGEGLHPLTLQAKRIGLVSPYPPELDRASVAYWQSHGFEVCEVANVASQDTAFHPIYAMAGSSAVADSRCSSATSRDSSPASLRNERYGAVARGVRSHSV